MIVPEDRREAAHSVKMPLHSVLPPEHLVPEWPDRAQLNLHSWLAKSDWPNRSYQLAEAASQAARLRVAVEAQTLGEVVAVPCSEEKEEQAALR